MDFISLFKKIPVDLGQAGRKHDTAGKRIAFSLVPSVVDKTALDIGCRDGYWAEQLKRKGYQVSALDIEPNYENALKHNVEHGLPYGDCFFDVAWCTEVIEHLTDPKFLLKEIQRVTKPGGMAVLTTPNSGWWFYSLVGLWGWKPEKLQNKDHKQFFIEKTIRPLASGYRLLGYFPYAFCFFAITHCVGLLSPTFILVKKFKIQ